MTTTDVPDSAHSGEETEDVVTAVVAGPTGPERSGDEKAMKSSGDIDASSPAEGKNNQRNHGSDEAEFPFFVERRAPFYWFNICCIVFNFALFIYFTVAIVQDFISQQNSPPTTTNLLNGLRQNFPGIAVCNHNLGTGNDYEGVKQAPIKPIFATFYDGSVQIDIVNQLKRLECDARNASAEGSLCWYLDVEFPAFEYVSTGGTDKCSHRNVISFAFDINSQNYSSDVLLQGLDGYLFAPGKSEKVVDALCNNLFPSSCLTLVPPTEKCDPDETDLSLDTFFVTNTLANLVDLKTSQTQTEPKCSSKLLQWNPQITVSSFNPIYFEKRNILLSQAENAVLVQFQFKSQVISESTFNPQSGQAMFGSLSGWFGFLSDGWGILSVLFMSEQLINYLRAKYWPR